MTRRQRCSMPRRPGGLRWRRPLTVLLGLTVLLAAAGPLANLLACAAVLAFMQWAGYSCGGYWFACCNLLVGGSSLLPLPGLDGWHVAACLLHFLRK